MDDVRERRERGSGTVYFGAGRKRWMARVRIAGKSGIVRYAKSESGGYLALAGIHDELGHVDHAVDARLRAAQLQVEEEQRRAESQARAAAAAASATAEAEALRLASNRAVLEAAEAAATRAEIERLEAVIAEAQGRLRVLRRGFTPTNSAQAAAPGGLTRNEILEAREAWRAEGAWSTAIAKRLHTSPATLRRARKVHGLVPWPDER